MKSAPGLVRSFLAPVRRIWEDITWARRRYAPPSPQHVKWAVLIRNGNASATWVETGTYMGDTTHFLAQHARRVISIEPEARLYARASARLAKIPQIELYHGTSETILPKLMPTIEGRVGFWLDGHYSGGATFAGSEHTPIRDELRIIESHLERLPEAVIFIDDVRCFDPAQPAYKTYPHLDFLVHWASRNRLKWSIEQDIFVARSLRR